MSSTTPSTATSGLGYSASSVEDHSKCGANCSLNHNKTTEHLGSQMAPVAEVEEVEMFPWEHDFGDGTKEYLRYTKDSNVFIYNERTLVYMGTLKNDGINCTLDKTLADPLEVSDEESGLGSQMPPVAEASAKEVEEIEDVELLPWEHDFGDGTKKYLLYKKDSNVFVYNKRTLVYMGTLKNDGINCTLDKTLADPFKEADEESDYESKEESEESDYESDEESDYESEEESDEESDEESEDESKDESEDESEDESKDESDDDRIWTLGRKNGIKNSSWSCDEISLNDFSKPHGFTAKWVEGGCWCSKSRVCLVGTTWLDVWKCADKLMKKRKCDHVYIEWFRQEGDTLIFGCGS